MEHGMLPDVLPLFPLPNVVLFPQVLLPLHVFEPRYRKMVEDVSERDELIGMLLYRPGGEQPPDRQPDVYPVGCAGRMIRKVPLDDGRYNILLQGVREFEIRSQRFEQPYREAEVVWRPAAPRGFRLDSGRREVLVERIRAFVRKKEEPGLRILDDPTLTDEMLVNLFAFALDLPVAEKQGLLEVREIAARAERLIETIDFNLLEREVAFGREGDKERLQ